MPTPAATKPPVATSVDTSAESATTSLYRAAIGPINNDYYLPIFTRFEVVDRAGLSWNMAASLYTLNWMVFRQLWRAAGLYAAAVLGAAILLLGAGFLFQLSESTEWGLWLVLLVLSFVVPGLYGNAWLHAASRKKMASALTASATLREACVWLYQRSSTRQRFIWMGVVNLVLAGLAAGAYLAFSQLGAIKAAPSKSGEVRNQNVGKLTVESSPAVPVSAASAASALAPPVALAASSAASVSASASVVTASAPASVVAVPVPAPAPAPALAASSVPVSPVAVAPKLPLVPDPAYLDAMAAATARYVPRRSVMAEVKPATDVTVAPAPAPVASAPVPASTKTDAKVKEKEKEKEKEKSKAAKEVAADKPYAINVGLFANGANALNAYTKLVDAGLAASMQEVKTANGQRTRVRVGPFSNRAEAEAAVKKILALQLEAVLVQPQ